MMAIPEPDILGRFHRRRLSWPWLLVAAVVFLVVGYGWFVWFIERVEVDANELVIVVNKTGRELPMDLRDEFGDQVVLYPELVEAIAKQTGLSAEAVRETYKGIRYEVTLEGRHFFNPYFHRTVKVPATIIANNEVGVLIRRYGRPLAFPKTVATEPYERGPVERELAPGRYNINTLAHVVQRFPAVEVPPGHVGVVTLLSGDDPKVRNTYTVEPGEKGVQRETLPPGLVYYNPYLKRVDIVDIRDQRYDMRADDVVHFPSSDSFTITMEGTITWAIRPDRAAEVTVAYGDRQDILNKVIMPNARSIARIQGSKLQAREFITGETRKGFQDHLLDELRRECRAQGIAIKDALVREILPPAEIATPISQREQASQEIERSTNQMEEAKAETLLVEQRELQEQNRRIGDARRDVVTVTKEAEQRRGVVVTDAQRDLEVARLTLEAAEKEAAAILARGQAEANVILFQYEAKAEPLKRAVSAFGDGTAYAQHFFLRRIAPSIQSILSNTEGPFAEIFKQFQSFPPAPQKGESP
jgi:regulator of protease activity HflC (stomatin/prohibitin superfamily)